ncbi:MAG: MFS transporter [Candidatus Aenigmarchaeota archaeon]|nr:MFS transporter [Candidatus Aenigmarchaeota archaeon]
MKMDETKGRLYSGAGFGFLHTILMAFSMIVPAFYFSSLDISIAVYGFLIVIGDVISFFMKPVIGYLTDKYGERKFLIGLTFFFFFSLFLIGLTKNVIIITLLKIVSGIASAILFVIIIIYGLRTVRERPDSKVGTFGATKNLGWVLGLLMPGFVIDRLGIMSAFYLVLVIGILWLVYMFRATKKYERVKKIKVRPSLLFIKKIPLLVIYKSMDLAVFTAFLFFFTRYALQSLGMSRGIVSIIVVIETIGFSFCQYIVGRVSNKPRRKYWVPLCILSHIVGILIMVYAKTLIEYSIAGLFMGIAGGFIDIWLFSRISESVKKYDKGVFYGTFGWSYDLATIIGGQIPVLFVSIGLNVFASMLVFPGVMLIGYLLSKKEE